MTDTYRRPQRITTQESPRESAAACLLTLLGILACLAVLVVLWLP